MSDDLKYILNNLKEIMNIDSPSGFTQDVIAYSKKLAEEMGFETALSNKGNLIIEVPGESDDAFALCAHVDTLGLMVRSIKSDGTLAITKVGGHIMPTLDGEYCRIYTRDKKIYTGTIISNSPAVHVFKDAETLERNVDTMCVRIDEEVKSKEDVLKLGINNGDFIAYDPKTVITESGFVKSRFLDDKLSVSILFGVLNHIKEHQIKLKNKTYFMFSTYEEVGHGMAWIPEDISEILAVDMGCIGSDLSCTEYDVSICAKDSSGPYDQKMVDDLVRLAKENELSYAIDIYPYYGSDVSASLRGGNNIRGALIGSGVAASHGMERTHIKGIENTFKLILAYLNK